MARKSGPKVIAPTGITPPEDIKTAIRRFQCIHGNTSGAQ
jgi:hypothetical protein